MVDRSPPAKPHHGVRGETEEVAEVAHEEAEQLCGGAEGKKVVCETQREEGQGQEKVQLTGEDPSIKGLETQRPFNDSVVPGRPGETEAS